MKKKGDRVAFLNGDQWWDQSCYNGLGYSVEEIWGNLEAAGYSFYPIKKQEVDLWIIADKLGMKKPSVVEYFKIERGSGYGKI